MDKTGEALARLREERARLVGELAGVDRAIAALEEVMEAPVPAPARPAVPAESRSRPVLPPPTPPSPPGPYRELTFYEAAAQFLREAGEPKTSREIATALLAGDYRTDSADFYAVARSMLGRPSYASSYGIRQNGDGKYWFDRTSASNAAG